MCTTPLEAGVDSSPSAVHPVTRPDYHFLAGLPWTLEIVHSAVRHQLGCRDTHTLRLLLDLWNLLGVGQTINSQSDHQQVRFFEVLLFGVWVFPLKWEN